MPTEPTKRKIFAGTRNIIIASVAILGNF